MNLKSLAITCAATVCTWGIARADVTYDHANDGDNRVDVLRITVTPAAEPVPALRHRLLTREIDLKQGNAVPYYYRALLDLPAAKKQIQEAFSDEKEFESWYETGEDATPLERLPLEKVRSATKMFDGIYDQQLQPAFVRSDCDWELGVRDLRGPETIQYLLPEFQSSRDLSRMMSLRIRLAVAERRYDDAIELMRQQYRLGHDVAKVPFLVCGLIGTAIDGMTTGTLTELVASSESPNMYWALTELPQPQIDLQTAMRFELDFGPRMFPFIDHPESADHAPDEWNRLFTQGVTDYSKVGGNLMGGANGRELAKVEAGVAATGLALVGYSHAKEQLIAQGMDRERVEKMAVGQVIAVYTARINARVGDNFEKLWYVSFPEMEKHFVDEQKELLKIGPFGNGPDREILPMMTLLLPAIQNCRAAQVRSERQIAALRIIEAIRMYAADHAGALPKKLDDIREVPVPLNPATDKAFVYHLDGNTAVLELPTSDHVRGACRYEIQLASDKK